VKEQVEAEVVKFGEMGIRTLAVAKMEGHNGEWKMMGLLTFLDPPRPDTKQTIIDAKKYGKKRTFVPLVILRSFPLCIGMLITIPLYYLFFLRCERENDYRRSLVDRQEHRQDTCNGR
jgi:hypothetical protein